MRFTALIPMVSIVSILAGTACSTTTDVARSASEPALNAIQRLHTNEPLEVEALNKPAGQSVHGYLLQVGPTETRLREIPGDQLLVVENSAIRRVSYASERTGALEGGLIGFFGGALVGGTIAALTYSDPCANSKCINVVGSGPSVFGTGLIVGAVSAAVGIAFGSTRHFTQDYVFGPTVKVDDLCSLSPIDQLETSR